VSANSFQVCAHLLPSHRLQTCAVDLFHPRPMITPQTSPPSMTYDSQEPTPYDVSSISLFLFVRLFSNRSQLTNPPSASTSPHLQLPPSDRSTAQGTAIDTTDHRYTRARFNHLAPPYSHVQHNIHITQRWPDVDGSIPISHISTRSASPEVSSPHSHSRQQLEHGVGPSRFPDNEQTSSPMTSSPQMTSNPTEFAPQPTSFEQRSVETHSGKKRHKCNVCGSYWGRPSSLKIHMVSHTGVKGVSWSNFPFYSQPYRQLPRIRVFRL
jgi:hypothetical protein